MVKKLSTLVGVTLALLDPLAASVKFSSGDLMSEDCGSRTSSGARATQGITSTKFE
jgi:hypothetical protein